MFAIIRTGGKQYRVAEQDLITVDKISGQPGDAVQFGEVLLLGGENVVVGSPMVAGEMVEQGRGEKVIAFKKRRRKNSRRKRGHRQEFSVIRITEILTEGRKPTPAEAAPRAEVAPRAPRAEPPALALQPAAAQPAPPAQAKPTAPAGKAEAKPPAPAAKTEGEAKKTEAKPAKPKAAKPAKKPAAKPKAGKPAATPAKKPAAKKPAADKGKGKKK